MDDEFETQLDLARAIAAEIDSLTFEFGPDAGSHVAALRKQALDALRAEPRFQALAREVSNARIALRRARIDTARRLQSNGVEENRHALDLFLWDSRLVDHFTANLGQGEKLVEVKGFTLTTNHRSYSRAELKAACRMTVEMNNAQFERNFVSDAEVQAAEVRQTQRENPISPGSRGSVSNSDWPHR